VCALLCCTIPQLSGLQSQPSLKAHSCHSKPLFSTLSCYKHTDFHQKRPPFLCGQVNAFPVTALNEVSASGPAMLLGTAFFGIVLLGLVLFIVGLGSVFVEAVGFKRRLIKCGFVSRFLYCESCSACGEQSSGIPDRDQAAQGLLDNWGEVHTTSWSDRQARNETAAQNCTSLGTLFPQRRLIPLKIIHWLLASSPLWPGTRQFTHCSRKNYDFIRGAPTL
jgi:hypothetical protein